MVKHVRMWIQILINNIKTISNSKGNIHKIIQKGDVNFSKFGELYISELLPNKIKAWKLHLKQTQNITVPIGKVC